MSSCDNMIFKYGVKMKTTSFFAVFIALAMLVSTVGAATVYDNSLQMANVTVSPNPVVAGGNVLIHFRTYDAYSTWLYGTTLQPSSTYPLLNASPLNEIILGTVNPGLGNTTYNYNFQVPSTVQSGTYTITFTSQYFVYAGTGALIATSTMPVSFYVQNYPQIKITASGTQPSALYSGYNQTVDLAVQNVGYGTARNISVSVAGGSGVNLLSSVRSFFISNLTSGSTVTEPIVISAQGVGTAVIMANASYYSQNFNKHFSTAQDANLSIAPAAQFTISSQSKNIGVGTTDAPVGFVITNTGTSDAKQIQLSLQTSYPITPVASTAYITDLPPGQSTNVTFLVSVDSAGVAGSYPVTLYEQWKQPNGAVNQQFTGSNNYYVGVGSTGGSITTLDIIIGVVVVAAIIVILRRRGGQKSAKKEKK